MRTVRLGCSDAGCLRAGDGFVSSVAAALAAADAAGAAAVGAAVEAAGLAAVAAAAGAAAAGTAAAVAADGFGSASPVNNETKINIHCQQSGQTWFTHRW